MIRNTFSSKRYDGIRVESVHRKRRGHNHSKIRPKDDEKNRSKISEPTWLTSSEIINPVNKSDTSFSITRQEVLSSNLPTENNAVIFNNNNKNKQSKRQPQTDQQWKYILMLLYGVLCILLLTSLMFPSILVYCLAPKFSSTRLSISPEYANNCADVSSNSLWQIDTTTTITMQIDTSECNFNFTPLYFVSIAGVCSHDCLTGYNAIYFPTTGSFQIYAQYSCGVWNATDLLNSSQICGWDVNWMGFFL